MAEKARVYRALAREPSDRYASAAAMADDLEAWLRLEPIAWTRPSWRRRLELWTRRKPDVARLVAASSALVILVSIVAVVQTYRSAAAWHEAAVQKARVEGARESVVATLSAAQWLKSNKFDEQMPMLLLGWDSLNNERFLGSETERRTRWKQRESIARGRVADLRAQGRAGTLDALVWESCLGLWLLCDGKASEAAVVLDGNLALWRQRLAADDPWLRRLELLATAARAEVSMSDSTDNARELKDSWEEFARVLEGEQSVFAGPDANNALRRPVLNALVKLYAPGRLNRSADQKRAQAAIRAMD